MKKILAITLFTSLFISSQSKATEQLQYTVLENEGRIEVRDYDDYLMASVTYKTKKEYEENAFKTLFKYISGDNTNSQDIDMTAPVIINDSTKIPMTAPVFINQDLKEKVYEMSFVLPSFYTYSTAPRPLDSNIVITKVPRQLKASIRFSGFMSARKTKKYTNMLVEWIMEDGRFKAISSPLIAGYNSPMTPPFLRRNEIIIAIDYK